MTIKVLPMWDKSIPTLKQEGWTVISTVSHADGWNRELSPFVLGPCPVCNGTKVSQNMENAWQYSKVYPEHVDHTGWPSRKWWRWAMDGWNNPRAVRYPMGNGARPLYSLWFDPDGHPHRLKYVSARKIIYGPLYRNAVEHTPAYRMLKQIYQQKRNIVLLDFDAYDHAKLHMTLGNVLCNPMQKMGHAFVLAMMLTDDPALTLFGEY